MPLEEPEGLGSEKRALQGWVQSVGQVFGSIAGPKALGPEILTTPTSLHLGAVVTTTWLVWKRHIRLRCGSPTYVHVYGLSFVLLAPASTRTCAAGFCLALDCCSTATSATIIRSLET